MKTIDQRIEALEKATVSDGGIPGTTLRRVLKAVGPGWEWSLGLGRMQMPKRFFTGATIEACISAAEAVYGIQVEHAE